MIVCICRAINEKKINQSIDGGAITAKQVYCSLGIKPKCGKCRPEIQQMIDTALNKLQQYQDIQQQFNTIERQV